MCHSTFLTLGGSSLLTQARLSPALLSEVPSGHTHTRDWIHLQGRTANFVEESAPNPMHTIKTDDLLGCFFLLPPDANGETHCATVIQKFWMLNQRILPGLEN